MLSHLPRHEMNSCASGSSKVTGEDDSGKKPGKAFAKIVANSDEPTQFRKVLAASAFGVAAFTFSGLPAAG